MELKLFILPLLFMINVNGQRIVNKFYFILPASTTIDTTGNKFSYKWYDQEPTDFYKYKSDRMALYHDRILVFLVV